MIDCLIIGFNDSNFEQHVQMVRSMGADSGAYRDLNLAFIEYDNKPYRSMDLLNHFYFGNKGDAEKRFSNVDFLWPVVLYLGTYLHRRGFTFDYVNLFALEKDKLREKLRSNEILTVAITTTLYVTAHPILEIISFIREHNEKAKIIVGGPYIHNQTRMVDQLSLQQQFRYIGADFYVISQEGEAALVNLLNALKQGSSLDQVDNIAYRQGKRYVQTASSIESNPLEENMVDYSLFPSDEIDQFISLRTAKSCPFSCAFCGFPQRAGKYKYITVELVEKELNTLADLGVTTVTFLDDTFNVPKGRFQDLLQMMIRNKYGFKWNSFYRSDHGDPDTIELMARAGCEGVFLGVESGSDQMLERMNKTSRRKNYMEAIPLLQAAGVSAHANLIVGFPGETYETVQETVSLIEEARPDFFRAQLWYADPMTPIWKQRDQYGVQGSSFHWTHNTMDYQTACDLIDKIFLSMENSIWLPQNGFEQWSTFYLQRRGMSRQQIKTFLRCFNTAVKGKLINPNKKEIDPELLESLKASCQFDKSARPDMSAVEIQSGATYREAEKYWLREFGGPLHGANLDLLRDTNDDLQEGQGVVPCAIERNALDVLMKTCETGLLEISLAAYSALLSRLSGRQEVVILAALGDRARNPFPVKVQVGWEISFRDLVDQLRGSLPRAIDHSLYGLSILTNPWRMAEHGAVPPPLDVGYCFSENSGNGAAQSMERSLELHPDLRPGIALALNVSGKESDTTLVFSYQRRWFNPETVETLAAYLESLLEEASNSPEMPLGNGVFSGASSSDPVTAGIGTLEEFNF